MADFRTGFEDLGSTFIDTAADLVGGFGDRFANEADRIGVANQVAQTKIQLALSGESRKAEREKQLQKLLNFSVYFLLFLVAAGIGANIYKKLK